MRAQRLIRPVGQDGGRTTTRRGQGPRRLMLEPLEDRRLLAVLDVGPGARYAKIQAAVDAARPGDVLLVADGEYAEAVDLSRMGIVRGGVTGDLSIRGESDQAIIAPRATAAFFNSAPFTGDLSIEGLTISGASAGAGVRGVRWQQVTGDLRVSDAVFEQLSGGGVEVTGLIGDVGIQSSLFDRVGGAAQDAAVRLSEVRGAGAISSNDFEDGRGAAIVVSSTADRESTWLVNDNRIYGDVTLFSTTETGIRARLSGDSRTDLILTGNLFEGLAGSAIDVQVQDQAELQTRWSLNTASNLNGTAAAQLTLRGDAAGALLADTNTWNDVFGSGLSIRVEGSADLRATVQYDAFTSIGDGQGGTSDDALAITTSSNATGKVDLYLFYNSISTVSGNGLRISADGTAAVRAVVADNAFDETNTATSGASLLVEHASAAARAGIDLRLENNSAFRQPGDAYLLRQRGTAVMRLEGEAASAAEQIVDQNLGEPVTVTGTVGLIAPGTLDASLPLVLGDSVWVDDGDGVQSSGEEIAGGVVIRLSGTETAGGAAVHRITQSDAAGTYLFPSLAPGQYTLTLDAPFAMRLAAADLGGDDEADSDFDPASSRTAVTLVAATDQLSVDAGLWRTWQNPRNPLDVDDDGDVIPLDALVLINDINANNSRPLTIPLVPPSEPPPYLDVNGNGEISPQDVLIIINYLNGSTASARVGAGGEGESSGELSRDSDWLRAGTQAMSVVAGWRAGRLGPSRLRWLDVHSATDRFFAWYDDQSEVGQF